MTATAVPSHQHQAAPTSVVMGIAKRAVMLLPRTPASIIPSVAFPILVTIALGGALAGVSQLPGYPVARQVDWVMPFSVVQAGALAGMGVGFSMIRDLESGFFDRLLLTPVSRLSLVVGFLLSAFARGAIPLLVVTPIGMLDGARIPGGFVGFLCLAAANQGAAIIGGAWGVGMALRFGTMRAAPLMFLPVFVLLFLSTSQVPLEYITGWLEPVARWNPVTQVLKLARAGFIGPVTWDQVWPGLVVIAVLVGALTVFALRGLRRLEP